MSTEATYEILATDLGQTEKLGQKIAHNLRGGEVIELVSDLGGGKTAFVRSVANALGYKDVASPSFTIHNVYPTKELELHHYDFYRLEDVGVVAEELKEMIIEPNTVIFIEWGERVRPDLPAIRIRVKIMVAEGEERKFNFTVPDEYEYLMKGVVL